MMATVYPTERGAAGDAAAAPSLAGLHSAATPLYPFAGIGSTTYAAGIIAARFGVLPAIAYIIAELFSIGGDA